MCYENLQVNPYQKSANICRIRFPLGKLGSKGFGIADCFILVNDPGVTESCNNGQLFPFLMHSYDYLEIIKDGRMVGTYCGTRTGENVFLTGDQIVITFHSDLYGESRGRGFLIHFTAGPHGKYFS